MPMWILELFDNWFNCAVIVGVYSTPDKAEIAENIIMEQLSAKNPNSECRERYISSIIPIQTDSFIDAAMAWISE